MLAVDCGGGTRGRGTHIEAFRFRTFLEVHTDGGLMGLGESYFEAKRVEACVDEVAHHDLLGKNALDIGKHAKELNGYLGYSASGTQTRGDSAIDIALRDLFGNISGHPVYQLLVAVCRQKVRACSSCAGYRHARVAIGDAKSPVPKGGGS